MGIHNIIRIENTTSIYSIFQGDTNQDVFVGQRTGDSGGQQVRHGGRTCG